MPEQLTLFHRVACERCQKHEYHDCPHPAGVLNQPVYQRGKYYRTTYERSRVVHIDGISSVYRNTVRDPKAPAWAHVYRLSDPNTGERWTFYEHDLMPVLAQKPVRRPQTVSRETMEGEGND